MASRWSFREISIDSSYQVFPITARSGKECFDRKATGGNNDEAVAVADGHERISAAGAGPKRRWNTGPKE